MSCFKTPFLCDRRVYDKRGKWHNNINDLDENIYYFIAEPLTLVPQYVNGRQEMVETLTITVFGSKPFAYGDIITLQNGTTYRVKSYVAREYEPNILVRDMMKTRIYETDLVLA